MSLGAISSIVFILIIATIIVRKYLRWQTRKRLRNTPLSSAQRKLLAKEFPLFQRIPNEERTRLEGLVNQFIAEKKFHGAEGMSITDEMRLLIAAQACILIVNKPNRWFDELETIIVYPAAFRPKRVTQDGYIQTEIQSVHAGESWMRGPVLLAWDYTLIGAKNSRDGHNLVIHEFAHQLDQQTGVTDGAPLLDSKHTDSAWAKAFQDAYKRHTQLVENGHPTLIDEYGATNPAEFFAVSVEIFFEKGIALKKNEPELYKELTRYFKVNPAKWN